MYKIGVIGDRESVLGFKAVGLEVFPCVRQAIWAEPFIFVSIARRDRVEGIANDK